MGYMYPKTLLGKPDIRLRRRRKARRLEGAVLLQFSYCLRCLEVVIDGHQILLLFFVSST